MGGTRALPRERELPAPSPTPRLARIDLHSSNLAFEELPQVHLYDPSPEERRTARLFGLAAIIERPGNAIFSATLGHAWRDAGGESFVI